MNWSEKLLEEVADFSLGKMLDQKKNRGEFMPYLANINVRWGEFNFENLREMRFEPGELDRFCLKYGDIVMCEGGEPGRCAIWKDQVPGMMIQKALHRIRPHPCLDNRFLFYSFLKKGRNEELSGLFTGSTIKHLPREKLAKVRFDIPPLPIQQRIADILSTYDDLIENNRRRITLLEKAARLLYREWFVHFRFPDHKHVKIIGGIPEGWKRKTYSALFNFLCGFAFKSKTYHAEGKFGIVTIKNVHEAQFVPECPSRLDDAPEKMPEHCALVTGDILLSLTGNVGRACIVFGENYLLNQRVAKVVGNSGVPRSFTYWTFSNATTQKELENLAYGVAQLNLSPVKLGEYKFLSPSPIVLNQFRKIADPLLQLITTLNSEIVQLSQARDLLLPRLMNGEIAV